MLNKFFRWLYLHFHSIFTRISIALFNTEMEILKADPNINDESKKMIQRKRHRNEILEKFYAGQRDEKYVQDFYEILKKADTFLVKSTPLERAISADKHSKTFLSRGKENEKQDYHEVIKDTVNTENIDVKVFGFYDEKHKHYGKTIEEIIELEYQERRTKDDDYEIVYIYNNKPIDVGLFENVDLIEKDKVTKVEYKKVSVDNSIKFEDDNNEEHKLELKTKQLKFPLNVYRETEVLNKIEELTEFLHIKKTAFDERILEFFIPTKFKTNEFDENSGIFKELINIKEVYFNNDYGDLYGFGVKNYRKRVDVNGVYDVIKFDAVEMTTYTKK